MAESVQERLVAVVLAQDCLSKTLHLGLQRASLPFLKEHSLIEVEMVH